MTAAPLYLLTLPDSEVARVQRQGDVLRLVFAAAHAHTLADGKNGYLRPLELVLHGARCQNDLACGFGRIQEARLCLAGEAQPTLPVPGSGHEPVQLALTVAYGAALFIEAQGWETRFSGPASFQESMAC